VSVNTHTAAVVPVSYSAASWSNFIKVPIKHREIMSVGISYSKYYKLKVANSCSFVGGVYKVS
jgi:hypothetical protein